MPPNLSPELQSLVLARLAHIDAAHADAGVPIWVGSNREAVAACLAISDFAHDELRRDPAWAHAHCAALIADAGAPSTRGPDGNWSDDDSAMRELRRFRRRESLRLIARDVLGLSTVEQVLADCSDLAETCLDLALSHLRDVFERRYGVPRDPAGEAQALVVIGMGKLGGGELNFSSDIDLIFAFASAGQCDGPSGLANEDFFARLGQRLIQLLAEVNAEGFAYRVDMRLRPFGSAGRMALSFAAMEQYYQRDGRDWERYAWTKARPVAGDRAAGAELVAALRPFVFRRYLDYGAFDGLRELKRMIDAEVARKELADHIKLGPGGIREIEFMVQLVQLVRGGREVALRDTGLLRTLEAAAQLGFLVPELVAQLRAAYLFLRRVENRLQMLRDEQVHALPEDASARERLAQGLGYCDYTEFLAALDVHRSAVAAAFAATLGAGKRRAPSADDARYVDLWSAARESDVAIDADFSTEAIAALQAFARSAAVRNLEARTRARLDRLMPLLLSAAARQVDVDAALIRALRLMHAIAGRPSYFAMLDEQSAARERVIEVFARSAWLAERVVAHPLLLDDLLDRRDTTELPDGDGVAAALARRWVAHPDGDDEEALIALHEIKQSALFRLGLAWLARRTSADDLAWRLAGVAGALLSQVLVLAEADAAEQFGRPAGVAAGEGLLVAGYGSLGGAELGFGSDLDLVFVYDAAAAVAPTIGRRVVEGSRYFARVAQRVVHWLTAATRAGHLYEVDTRLRPDGAKGLLVLSMEAFLDYQQQRAWLWEHQALVRARVVVGDANLARTFETARAEILARARDPAALLPEVAQMRARWRAQLDRSDPLRIDLKQGRGGLVDIEFLVQALVLINTGAHPSLAAHTRTSDLLQALGHCGVLAESTARELRAAHEALLARALDCTLNAAPRLVPMVEELAAHLRTVVAAMDAAGLATPP